MLIHGAIIARRYGLSSVIGGPDVTPLVDAGDLIAVDGYLGIVTVRGPKEFPSEAGRVS